MMSCMRVLTPALRNYDWGTHDDIPALLGMPASSEPVAEAWWGAHPVAPALDAQPPHRPLDAIIADDAVAALGPQAAERWQTLPYLVKVLSIRKPLSIQVHPSMEQARAGYDREQTAGHDRSAPDRFFRDPSHKPEMVIALSPMVVLDGFRPVEDTVADLRAIGGHAGSLADALDQAQDYDTYVHRVLSMPDAAEIIADMVDAAELAGASASLVAAARAAEHHPGDSGALVALAMNVGALAPGEAMFTGAGIVHSYQSGMGLEVMANSDNVVRAGLTGKPVDVDLLCELAVTTPTSLSRVQPTDQGLARVFEPAVEEFTCSVISGGSARIEASARIVVALEGAATVTIDSVDHVLEAGQAAFVPHADGTVEVSAPAMAAVVSVPDVR